MNIHIGTLIISETGGRTGLITEVDEYKNCRIEWNNDHITHCHVSMILSMKKWSKWKIQDNSDE